MLSFVGNAMAGNIMIPTSFSIYELVYYLGFYAIGIIGVICVVFGVKSLWRNNGET